MPARNADVTPAAAVEAYRRHGRLQGAAAELGLPMSTLRRRLVQAGIAPAVERSLKRPAVTVEAVAEMVERCGEVKRAAVLLGVSTDTVRRRLAAVEGAVSVRRPEKPPPVPVPQAQPRDLGNGWVDMTGVLLGDPGPGRSALDQGR